MRQFCRYSSMIFNHYLLLATPLLPASKIILAIDIMDNHSLVKTSNFLQKVGVSTGSFWEPAVLPCIKSWLGRGGQLHDADPYCVFGR